DRRSGPLERLPRMSYRWWLISITVRALPATGGTRLTAGPRACPTRWPDARLDPIRDPPPGRRYVGWIENRVDQEEIGALLGLRESRPQLGAGLDAHTAPAERAGQGRVLPPGELEVRLSATNRLHHGVRAVVEEDHDRVLPEPSGGRKLEAGHLESAVADQRDRPAVRSSKRYGQRCRNPEPHAVVVARTEEQIGPQVDRGVQAVADVA